jgi:replication factor A1
MSLPPGVQVQPIDSLTPFLGNKWWIRGRVTDKSDIRRWNKPTSTGQLFSVTLVDETSSIRATIFQEAVDNLFPLLQNGNVYYFNGGQVKQANRKFSNVNNDYELTFDMSTQVIGAPRGSDAAIPTQRYNFVPVRVLQQREAGSLVDVLVVVTSAGDTQNIVQKSTGKELLKRSVKVADKSASIELTLWGDQAKSWSIPTGTVVAVRQVRTGSFDGVTLGSTFQTTFDVNPNLPSVRELHDWFATTGGNDVASLSNQGTFGGGIESSESYRGRKMFDDITAEGLGRGPKADFIDVRCVPVYVKQDAQYYDACPTCNRKVQPKNANNDQMQCEKCDKMVVPTQRYMISLQASDNVSQVWLTLFNEAGIEFYGMTADKLKEECAKDPTFLGKKNQLRMHRPVLMRIRAKEDRGMTPDAESRMQLTVSKITEFLGSDVEKPIDSNLLKTECTNLIESIKAYL